MRGRRARESFPCSLLAMSNPFPSVQDFKESLEVLSEDLDEGGMTTYLTGILKAVQSNGKEGPWKEVLKAYCVSPFPARWKTATDVRVQSELKAQYERTPMNAHVRVLPGAHATASADRPRWTGNGFAEAGRYVIGMVPRVSGIDVGCRRRRCPLSNLAE